MEATKEAEIKMSVQLGLQLGPQLQWNLPSLGAPEGSMLVLSIVVTESSRAISGMLSYCNYGVLLINQHFNEQVGKKKDQVQNNIRILESFVTRFPLHYMKTKQPKLLFDGGWKI